MRQISLANVQKNYCLPYNDLKKMVNASGCIPKIKIENLLIDPFEREAVSKEPALQLTPELVSCYSKKCMEYFNPLSLLVNRTQRNKALNYAFHYLEGINFHISPQNPLHDRAKELLADWKNHNLYNFLGPILDSSIDKFRRRLKKIVEYASFYFAEVEYDKVIAYTQSQGLVPIENSSISVPDNKGIQCVETGKTFANYESMTKEDIAWAVADVINRINREAKKREALKGLIKYIDPKSIFNGLSGKVKSRVPFNPEMICTPISRQEHAIKYVNYLETKESSSSPTNITKNVSFEENYHAPTEWTAEDILMAKEAIKEAEKHYGTKINWGKKK